MLILRGFDILILVRALFKDNSTIIAMIIRRAKKEVLGSIVDVELQSGFVKKRDNCFKMIDKLLTNKNHSVFVLVNKSSIIGYISISKKGEIGFLGVDKEFRKRGFGERLLKKVLKFAKEHKINNVFLEVRINNLPAKKLYLKNGFVITKVNRQNKLNKIRMEKRLK